MIARLIEGSARNPILVVLCVVLLAIGGLWAGFQVPLDAIPDLSDVQVIIYTEWQGRSPTLIEDQITYPIVTSLLAGPKVKRVRGVSEYWGLLCVRDLRRPDGLVLGEESCAGIHAKVDREVALRSRTDARS